MRSERKPLVANEAESDASAAARRARAASTLSRAERTLPQHDPMIEGVLSTYSIGDTVRANCTSAKSNPAATLEWFINGINVSAWLRPRPPPPPPPPKALRPLMD
ncbi:Uncharacterized protein GBIM_18862 [Gryllus bimaculatus]|nr:Uncharacterized protein GBIM_18862 [Gryllus bimaculatus]